MSLLNESLSIILSSSIQIEGQMGVKKIASVVIVGVLMRDYDFEKNSIESNENENGLINNTTKQQAIQIVGKCIVKELKRVNDSKQKKEGMISIYYCQLLRTYLRSFSKSVNQILYPFLCLFNEVSILLFIHYRF